MLTRGHRSRQPKSDLDLFFTSSGLGRAMRPPRSPSWVRLQIKLGRIVPTARTSDGSALFGPADLVLLKALMPLRSPRQRSAPTRSPGGESQP